MQEIKDAETVQLIVRQMLMACESIFKMFDASSIPPEQAKAVHFAIGNKRKGEVNDSVFYDVLLEYLAASLQTL